MATSDAAEQSLGDQLTPATKLDEGDEDRLVGAVEVTQQSNESGEEDDGEEFYDATDQLNEENDESVKTDETAAVDKDHGKTDSNEKTAMQQTDETNAAIINEIAASALGEIINESDDLQSSKDENTEGVTEEQTSEVKESGDSQNESVGDRTEHEDDNLHGDNDESGKTDERDNGDELPDQYEDASDEKSKPKPTTLEEDEELLRELEANMTDEEKEVRKQEAQDWKSKGNEFYKNEEYGEAIDAYVQALQICPLCYKKERAIMYSNRAACHLRLEEKDEAIVDCSKAIELHPVYIKALLRRAQTYEQVEKLDEALGDYQKVLELDPASHVARQACMRLPEEIKERNEKLKEEMMGKLKDLGNLILRPFGLSTNNFQLQQNPDTGSYSVNFSQGSQNNGK